MKQKFASHSNVYKGDPSCFCETEATQPVRTRKQYSAQIEIGEEENSKNRMRNEVFEALLLEAVDEGLSCLDTSTKQAFYLYLERTFKMSREDIPRKIEEFAEAIEEIFGAEAIEEIFGAGAKLLEIQIMKRLFEKTGHFKYSAKQEDIVFTEYVGALRKAFDNTS